jgi:hypothetical protein
MGYAIAHFTDIKQNWVIVAMRSMAIMIVGIGVMRSKAENNWWISMTEEVW